MNRVRADRLRELMERREVSQSELARRVGISQASVYKLVSGEGQGSKFIHRIASVLQTSPEYLMDETDDPMPRSVGESRAPYRPQPATADALVEVAEIDPRFGLGGAFMDEPPAPEMRTFSRAWLRQITSSPPEELYWAKGRGNSMSPTIEDGEVVLIDRTQQTPRDSDLVWAFAWGDVGAIKRLRPMPDGSVKILSDNQSVPADVAHDGELQIFGRVVAVVRRL